MDNVENNILNDMENLETDGNTSFLRAARNGQLEKVLEHLKTNIDINTSNANGLNALHLASKDGHVDIVEELLKRGAIVDAATKKGNTALHIASLAGQEEVVKLLVHHGASVNVQSQNGFTPLYMAAQENHDNVVKFLLANGANQSLSTEDGFTPLAVAMQQGHDKVVTVLLENDTRGKVRLPALHIAAKKDDVRAAKLLLENDHNPDVTSKSGFTPLHIASHYGNQSIANLLIQKGADVNYSAKHNITPLHVAAKWGKSNMVALLLEQGAHIEAKTRDGLTPLHCAARSGHEQVVDMLLEKSAPISSKTKNGLAPLHMAAQGDHVDAARILLYHRAPVDEVTVDYLTALHVAAHCGHVRVAKLLLDRQADANARALNGFTPLHIACKKNRIKVVELLLKHGACIGATTESGLTPLHVASFMGCMNIVIYLLQHDASPDIPTVRGETPLHLAARANQTDIIRILLRNGAQVDARAREQQTPLHIASRLGNVDIVMLLLQHGAKVDNTTKDMYTALHIAAKEGQDEVAAVLIENGASLNATTKKGFTPLHLAAKYGHLKVAKLLVQKEAPVDAQGKNGVTPLHVASHYDHQNVALLLLDKGASPHANAKNGHTPLHIAARKNQMDIAHTLLEYGAEPDAESKAGFTPLHLSSQEGHADISALLLEHKASPSHQSKNGLTPMHLCAQENKVAVAEILHKNGADIDASTKGGYTPLHIASHYGQADMVKFLLSKGANVKTTTSIGYTPLHQAAQQGHTNIVNLLLENSAEPNAITNNGQTPLHIAQKLGYITVIDTLKEVTEPVQSSPISEEKYRVVAPEAMHETFLSDSEEEGEDTLLGDQTYRYLTADEMKSLGDDSLPIDVTRDERIDSNRMVGSDDVNAYPPRHIEDSISPEHIHPNYVEYIKKTPDNIDISRHPVNIGFLVSFLVDARGGAMRGCRHSGVRVIVPPRCAPSPTRITCRYVRPQRTPHPPPLMEGEALASRVLELGPVGAKFLGPVIIEVPHFAALRGKEREIVILRSDNGESWKEHTIEATEDVLNEVLRESFEADDLNQLEDTSSGRITRIITQDFPQYFAVISRIRQEVHAIGPEGGMVSSTVVPQVQAVFPQGALTKKIKVGLQAQPIDPELTAKLLGHGVAVSPVVTVEPRRRKFHKAITLSMPAPRAHSQGMINQYSGSAPTLRLLCSITGGTSRAQWEDVTGSTPLTFVNDCVSFTTTVSARFWLMDCRNIGDATKMATELYREAIHVPFIAKFVVFAKRIDPLEARLRVFCMTDDKEEKTLEYQEQFTEIAKSRDVEVLEGKSQYIEFAGNLIPITKSGEQLQFSFRAFRENRLPFSVRVKDQHAEAVSRCLFMREPKVQKGEPPQQPICILNIVLPDDIVSDTISLTDSESIRKKYYANENFDYYRQDPRLADMSNLLGDDWVSLANQLGLTSSEINVIKSEYPDSVAKQAQSMLRMWLSQSGNRTQANTLDNALRRIGREDIVNQCLNVDNRSQQILRLRTEEKESQRLRSDIADDGSNQKRHYAISEQVYKPTDTFDKYSAEEKTFEPSDEEEDFNKTVPERREQIVKRLSTERTIPASSQRVEIVQEISSIKRQSLVEDKIAEVQQKVNIEPMKITNIKPVSKIIQEKKTLSEAPESKTTSPPEKAPEIVSYAQETDEKPRTTVPNLDGQEPSDRRDSVLLEEVTQLLEFKKPVPKLITNEEPKSPKFSKTPPPSPADFASKEKQASTAQEWEASEENHEDVSNTQPETARKEIKGKTTSTQYLDKLEETLLDKNVDPSVVDFPNMKNFETNNSTNIINETNAFIQSECKVESNEDKNLEMLAKDSTDLEDSSNKSKKGFLGSLKSFIIPSSEKLDSESNKSSPKKEKKKNKNKDNSDASPAVTRKPRLPTPPESLDREVEDQIESSKKYVESAGTKNTFSLSSEVKEEISQEKIELTKEYNTIPKIDDAEAILEQPIKINEKLQTEDVKDNVSAIPTEISFSSSENVDPSETSAKKEKEDRKSNRKLFGLFGKTSKERDDSDESEIIEKQDKEISTETLEKRKKTGLLGFLTKKSKGSSEEAPEINNDLPSTREPYLEMINETNSFLLLENQHYEDNFLPSTTKVDNKKANVIEEIKSKTSSPKSFFSGLKIRQDSEADKPSYIKFDGDDYELINSVSPEKSKKVTFEKDYEDGEKKSENGIQEEPDKVVCRLLSNTSQVQPTSNQMMKEQSEIFLANERENYDSLEREEIMSDIIIKKEDSVKYKEECVPATKSKGIFSIFSKKDKKPKEEIINKNEENIQKETLATKQKLHGNDAKQKDTEAEQEKRMISFTNEFIEIEKLEHNKEKTEKIIYEEKLCPEIQISGVENTPDEDKVGPVEKEVVETIISKEENASKVLQGKNLEEDMSDIVSSEEILKDEEQNLKTNLFFLPETIIHITNEFLQSEKISGNHQDCKLIQKAVTEHQETLKKENKSKGIFKIFGKKSESPEKKKEEAVAEKRPHSELHSVPDSPSKTRKDHERTSSLERGVKPKGLFKFFSKKKDSMEAHDSDETATQEGMSKEENVKGITAAFLEKEKSLYGDDIKYTEWSDTRRTPSTKVDETAQGVSYSGKDVINKEDFVSAKPSADRRQQEEPNLNSDQPIDSNIGKNDIHSNVGLIQLTDDFLNREKDFFFDVKCSNLDEREGSTVNEPSDIQKVSTDVTEKGVTLRRKDSKSKGLFKIFKRRSQDRDIPETDTKVSENEKETIKVIQGKEALLSSKEKTTEDESKSKGIFKIFRKKTETPEDKATAGTEDDSKINVENARKETGDFLNTEKKFYHDTERKKDKDLLQLELSIDQESKEINEKSELGAEDAIKLTEDFSHLDKSSHHEAEQNKLLHETRETKEESIISKIEDKGKTQEILFNEEIYKDNEYITELAHKSKTTEIDTTEYKSVKDDAKSGKIFKIFRKKTDKVPIDITEQVIEEKKTTESQTKSKSLEEKSSKDDSKNKGIFKLLKKKTESSTQSAPTGIEGTSGMTGENARQNTEEFLNMERELYQDIEKEKNKEALHSKLVIQSKVTDGKLEDEVESKGISKIFHKKEISTDEVTKETKGKNIVSTTEEFTITTKTVLRNGTDNILENGKNETIIQSKSEVIDGDKLSENSLVGEKFVVSTNKSVFNIFRKKEESSTDLPSANIEEQTHTENDGSRDSEEFLSNEKVFYEDAEQVLNLVKPSEISEKAIQQKKRGFFDIFSKTPENVEGKRPHQIIKEDITSSKVMTEEPTDIEGIKEKEHGESTKGFLRMEKDSYDDGKLIEVKSKISKGINEIDHVSEISEEPEPLQKKKERKGIFKIFRKTTAEANEAKILPELKSKSIDETITINDKSIIKSEPEVSDERKSSESSTIHIKKDLSGISVPIATEVPKVIHRDTINDTQELLGDEQIFYDDAKHATYHLKSWEISEEAIQQKEGKLSSIFSQTPKHEGKTHLPEEGIEAKKHCEVTNDFLKMEKTLYDDGKFIETKCETKEVENKNEQVLKISEEQQQPQKKKKQKGIFRVFGKTSAEVDEPKILPESKTKSVDKIEIDSSEMKNCDEKINGEITIQSKPKLAGTGKSSDNSFTDTKKERFQIEAPTDPQERMQTEGDSKKNTEEFLSNEQIFYEDSERVVDHIEPSGTVQQKRPGLFSKFSKTPENLDEHEKDIKTSVVTTEELSHEKETNDILKMEKTSYHDGKPIEKESEISEDEYKQEQVSEILAEQQQPQKKKKHKGIFKIFRKTSSELSETEIVPEVKSKSLDKTDVIISKETMNEVGPIFCGTKTEFIEKEDSLPEVKDVEQFSSLIVKEQVIPKKSSKIERIVHIVEEESKPGNREVFQSSNVEINRKLETEQPRNKDFQDLITATTEFKEMETIFHHDREDIQLNEKVNLNESQYIIDNSKNVPTDNTKNISEEKSADSQQSKVKEIINTIVDTLTFSNTETTKEDSNEKKDESKISEIVLKDVSVVTEEKQGPLSKTSKESKEGKKLRKDQKGKGIFNIFGRKSEERELKEKSDDTKDNGITKDEKLPLSEEIRDLSKKDEKDKKLFKIFGRKEKVKPEHDVEVPRPEELSTEKLKQLSYDFLDKEKIFYHDSEYVKRSPTTIGKEEILSSDSLIGKHDNVIPEYSVFSVPPSGGLIEEGMKTSEQTISNLKGKLVEETSESKISEIVSKDDTIDGPTEEQESSLSKTRKESKAEKKSRKDHKGKGLFNIFGRKSEERELHEKSDDIKNQNDVKENKIPKDEKLPLLEENSDLPKEDKKDKKLFKIFGKREKIKPEDDSEVRRPEDVSTDKLKQLSDDFLNKEKIFYHDSEYIQHSPAIFSREEILRNESLMEKHDIVIPEYSEKAINIDKTNILEANKQKIDENIREVSTIKVIERIESSVQSSEAIFKEREKTGEQTIPQLKGKLVEETSESKIIEIIPKDETIVISTKERESPILKTSKESKEEKTSRKDHKGKVLFNIFGRKSEERELQEESDDEKENKITQDKKFTLLEDNTDLSKEDKKDKKSFKIFGKRENIKHGNDFEVQRPEHVKESPDKLKQLNDEFLNKEKIFYHDSEYVQRPSATIGKEGISESESLIEKHDNVIPKYSENANNVGKIKIIDAKEQSIDENQKVLSPIKVVEDIESSLQSSGEIIKEGIKTGEKTISQLKVKLVEETSKSKVSEVVPKDETIVISIEERENPLLKTSKESKEEKKSRKDHKGKVLFNIFGRRSEERELQEEIDDIKNENDGEENKITKLTSLKENSDLSNEDKKDRKLFKIFSKKEKIKHGNDFEVQRPEDVKESSDMLRQLSDDFLNKERIFYHDSECVHSSPATIGKEEISESESLIEKHDNVVPKYSEKDNNVVRINIIDVKEQKLDENKKVHSPMKVVESIESSVQASGEIIKEGTKTGEQTISQLKGKLKEETSKSEKIEHSAPVAKMPKKKGLMSFLKRKSKDEEKSNTEIVNVEFDSEKIEIASSEINNTKNTENISKEMEQTGLDIKGKTHTLPKMKNKTSSQVDESAIQTQSSNLKDKKKKKSSEEGVKEERGRGILNFLSRRSKSKEKERKAEDVKDEEEDMSLKIEDTKLFLSKEIEMYHDVKSLCPTENLKSCSTEESVGDKDSKVGKSQKPTILKYLKKKIKGEQDQASKSVEEDEINEHIEITAAFLQNELRHFEDVRPEKKIQVTEIQERIPSALPDTIDSEEFTAFDFIKEEVDHFETTKLPSTQLIESSFKLETEIEEIDGEAPKEIIKKRIIISEKLRQLPDNVSSDSETSGKILEQLMGIQKELKDLVEQGASEHAYMDSGSTEDQFSPDIGYSKIIISRSITEIPSEKKIDVVKAEVRDEQKISGSQEKIENVESECTERMLDLELARGDVVEDVSPLESKIKRYSSLIQEKITDLDDISEVSTSNVIVNQDKGNLTNIDRSEEDKGFKDDCSPSKKSLYTKLNEKDKECHPELRHVTADFIKDLKVQYNPDDNLQDSETSKISIKEIEVSSKSNVVPYVTSPTMVRRTSSQRVSSKRTQVTEIPHDSTETIEETTYLVTDPDENLSDNRSDCDKRKPLFRLESDEDDFVTCLRIERRDSAKSNILEILSDDNLDNLLCDLQTQSSDSIQESTSSNETDETMVKTYDLSSSKYDIDIIEQKLRDLGKALDTLEKPFDQVVKDELKGKKLKRVERKFERMASEVLEPDTASKQADQSAETKQFQQLVSQLSNDEVISFQKEYNNLWDDYTFSKSDELDSKTPDSQADILDLPKGDASPKPSGSRDTMKDQSQESTTDRQDGQTRQAPVDQHQLSEEMKELLKEMEQASKK